MEDDEALERLVSALEEIAAQLALIAKRLESEEANF